MNAIKSNPPGTFKASGTGQGGIWHLALVGWLTAMGLKPDQAPWVPSNGAAPGLQDLVAGGVEVVTCSVPEARSLIEAGRVKSLAIMSDTRSELFPDLPTLKEAAGIDWTLGAWRGFAAPKGLPADIQDKLVAALEKIYKSAEFQDFMKSRGFGVSWAAKEDFVAYMKKSDESLGTVMKELGLAK